MVLCLHRRVLGIFSKIIYVFDLHYTIKHFNCLNILFEIRYTTDVLELSIIAT